MNTRSRLLFLIGIMAVVSLSATGVSIYWLYRLEEPRAQERMANIVRSQAKLIEEMSGRHGEATLLSMAEMVQEASSGIYDTGEVLIVTRKDEQIEFLAVHRNGEHMTVKPIPWSGSLAEPSRRALAGEAGTTLGLDYRGVMVIAAFEPVKAGQASWGLVAKVDLEEVQAPFRRAAMFGALLDLGLVLLAAVLFVRFSDPLYQRLQESQQRFSAVFHQSVDLLWTLKPDGTVVEVNRTALDVAGVIMSAVVGKPFWDARWWPDTGTLRDELQAAVREAAQGSFARMEVEARGFGNRAVTLDLSFKPITDRSGRVALLNVEGRDITERMRAERQLAERTTYLNALIEKSPLAIVVQDAEAHVVLSNPAFERLFGYSLEQARGKALDSLVAPPELLAEATAITEQAFRGVVHTAGRRQRSDSTLVEVEIHGVPLVMDGELRGVYAIYQDITERKRAEEALQRAEEKYRSIFENAVEGIFQTSPEGRFLTANPALARMLGYASADDFFRKRPDIGRTGYADPQRREEFKREMAERGFTHGFEYEAYRKDGGRVWLSENARAVCDASGDLLYYEGIAEDITERKQAERALAEQTAYLDSLIQNSPLAIVARDAQGRIRLLNPAFEKLFGYRRDEAAGRGIDELVAPEDATLAAEAREITEKVRKGETAHATTRRRRKDGSLVDVELFSVGLKLGEDLVGTYAIYQDITERRQAEEEREKLVVELQEALANIKTLSGLLPICASCKKIRDDGGYWSQIESYVSAHSQAQFSHGICPDCAKQLYPEHYHKMFPELEEKQPKDS